MPQYLVRRASIDSFMPRAFVGSPDELPRQRTTTIFSRWSLIGQSLPVTNALVDWPDGRSPRLMPLSSARDDAMLCINAG